MSAIASVGGGAITEVSATRPHVTFNDATPHAAAGIRTEPPRSVPTPSGLMPVAIATASPPLDPPGLIAAFHGFIVAPANPLSVCQRNATSGMFVRPTTIAPASRKRSTGGPSLGATASLKTVSPSVVAVPATSMFCLMVTGTPCSDPMALPSALRPAAMARSAVSAPARAVVVSTSTIALSFGLIASMRSRCASTISRLDASPVRMRSARSCAQRCQSSVISTLLSFSDVFARAACFGSLRCRNVNSVAPQA